MRVGGHVHRILRHDHLDAGGLRRAPRADRRPAARRRARSSMPQLAQHLECRRAEIARTDERDFHRTPGHRAHSRSRCLVAPDHRERGDDHRDEEHQASSRRSKGGGTPSLSPRIRRCPRTPSLQHVGEGQRCRACSSSPMPHDGTWSLGNDCSHTWRVAKADARAADQQLQQRVDGRAGAARDCGSRRSETRFPCAITHARWNWHSGHGSRPSHVLQIEREARSAPRTRRRRGSTRCAAAAAAPAPAKSAPTAISTSAVHRERRIGARGMQHVLLAEQREAEQQTDPRPRQRGVTRVVHHDWLRRESGPDRCPREYHRAIRVRSTAGSFPAARRQRAARRRRVGDASSMRDGSPASWRRRRWPGATGTAPTR